MAIRDAIGVVVHSVPVGKPHPLKRGTGECG